MANVVLCLKLPKIRCVNLCHDESPLPPPSPIVLQILRSPSTKPRPCPSPSLWVPAWEFQVWVPLCVGLLGGAQRLWVFARTSPGTQTPGSPHSSRPEPRPLQVTATHRPFSRSSMSSPTGPTSGHPRRGGNKKHARKRKNTLLSGGSGCGLMSGLSLGPVLVRVSFV